MLISKVRLETYYNESRPNIFVYFNVTNLSYSPTNVLKVFYSSVPLYWWRKEYLKKRMLKVRMREVNEFSPCFTKPKRNTINDQISQGSEEHGWMATCWKAHCEGVLAAFSFGEQPNASTFPSTIYGNSEFKHLWMEPHGMNSDSLYHSGF